MDFSVFNTRAAAERGTFVHFHSPVAKKPLYTPKGEKVGADVRGMESRTVQDALSQISKQGLTGRDATIVLLCALVIRFHHVEREEGQPLQPTTEDIGWLTDLSGSFEDQMMDVAKGRERFFTEPAVASSSTPAS